MSDIFKPTARQLERVKLFEEQEAKRKAARIFEEEMQNRKPIKESVKLTEREEQIRDRNIKMKYTLEVTEALIVECINQIVEDVNRGKEYNDNTSIIRNSIISALVHENGGHKLLDKFDNSILMNEYARIITENAERIIDNSDRDRYNNKFIMATSDKENFFRDLRSVKPDEMVNRIRKRVCSSIDDFNEGNIADKYEVTEIMNKMNEKMNNAKSENLKESYNQLARNQINKVKYKRRNVFDTMVCTMCEHAFVDKEYKSRYINESEELNVETVTEDCRTMYTVLETVNTLGLIKVDNNFIREMLTSLEA